MMKNNRKFKKELSLKVGSIVSDYHSDGNSILVLEQKHLLKTIMARPIKAMYDCAGCHVKNKLEVPCKIKFPRAFGYQQIG